MTKTKTVSNLDVFRLMEQWAPKSLAYDWDNVGLQIGSLNKPVKKIMVTLDVLESVVDEAINNKVDLIIAHHPLLFKSIKQVNTDTPQGRIIQKLILHNISVYASHTNLDVAHGGVNDILCELLNIKPLNALIETDTGRLHKISVFVPESYVNDVRDALSESGAGHIGNYSHCTFQTEGQGTFKPLDGTNPFIGTLDKVELVDEVKIETIVQEEKLQHTINAIIKAHPYEEVAYDIYPLGNQGKRYGIGRIGTLNNAQKLEDLCEQVKTALDISNLRVIGDLSKQVKTVAILGGSGEKYIHSAKQKGADVYITGDMTFHAAQEAWQSGLSVIDAGHYIEKVMKEAVKGYLCEKLQQFDEVKVITSESNTDPFQFV